MSPPTMSIKPSITGPLLLVLAGCAPVTPLTNHIAVGEAGYVIFVGEGSDDQTDLFASTLAGGDVVRFTFSRDREISPALDSTGLMVAYLRRGEREADPWYLAVMNLRTAAEREMRLPESMGVPDRVVWWRGGLLVRASGGLLATPAPPETLRAEAVSASDRPSADSALAVEIGSPVFGQVVRCPVESDEPTGLCVETADHPRQVLTAEGSDPLRWGADSVAYLTGGRLEVRPLGGGHSRHMQWDGAPDRPRQPTVFLGRPQQP
jgi:hypothetical protein